MALTTLTNGSLADADEVMNNFKASKIHQVYSGTGANNGSSYEFTTITPADLINADYITIRTSWSCYTRRISSTNGSVKLQIETKDVGGTYSDTLPLTTLQASASNTDGTNEDTSIVEFSWVHTLTDDEKASGLQIRITTTRTNSNNTITLKQASIINGFA